MRITTAVVALAGLVLLIHLPGTDRPAHARQDDGVSDPNRAEYIAERLAEDPIHISDHLSREVAPERADQLRPTLDGLDVDTYLAVVHTAPDLLRGEDLAVALHDRLGADGLYIVSDEKGIYFDAVTFGVELPVRDAIFISMAETPSDRGIERRLEVFVEALTADDRAERAERARSTEDRPLTASESREREEYITAGVSAGAVGVVVFAGMVVWSTLRRRGRSPLRAQRPGKGM